MKEWYMTPTSGFVPFFSLRNTVFQDDSSPDKILLYNILLASKEVVIFF